MHWRQPGFTSNLVRWPSESVDNVQIRARPDSIDVLRRPTLGGVIAFAVACCISIGGKSDAQEADDPDYYQRGELAGSLKSDRPLAIYADDPNHLWNRLFAAFYTRPSRLPARPDGPPVSRIEGGDVIDFLGWGQTAYWSSSDVADRLDGLLVEFVEERGDLLVPDRLKRAMLLRDMWAAFDFLCDQKIRRFGTLARRQRIDQLCRRLAQVISSLALSKQEVAQLPDTYAAAVRSGHFATDHQSHSQLEYLPHDLLTAREKWVEIDFYQPDLHEDLSDRFVTLHTRQYRGRSYFRIFYRFPGGRDQLVGYLQTLDQRGVDWRQAAQDGFVLLKPDAPQIPVGTEVALLQFMMTLDAQLRPTPTKIVESVRHRTFLNVDGSAEPLTNTGLGMNVLEYTLKRRLLFDDLCRGGLALEPDDMPQYRVIFQNPTGPDWGRRGREVLFQQCADCHMTPQGNRTGVHSMPSIVHMGGFNAGAQLGIAVPLAADGSDVRGQRAAKWKSSHETYRRLLEYLGR